jgi:serine/threonine protein kinase
MKFTVENVCGLLIGSKLLAPDEVKSIYTRWQGEARDGVGDLAKFTRWLVAHQFVTEYQAALVAKGHTDGFFINQYKILDRLGRGRMAGVYKAVHQLGQVVAVKVLAPSRSKNAQMLGRFQREARLAVRLKHPNVVRSFQIGQFRGLHYLVMEYLEGETLDVVLQRRKRLPAQEAARLIAQALQGLQHIHELGLVHRDLKPANLMLLPAPAKNDADTTLHATVKILDIGLGRVLNDDGDNPDDTLTSEGVLLGTPDYLAPEQARDPRAIDIRADIYSLGCVLYHIVTGQPPFPDTNVLSQMVRHATEMPKPLKELVPAIPDGLQQVINMMLAKEPAQRFATPEKAAQALLAFQAASVAPPRAVEEGPQLKKYLTWLEMNPENRAAEPVAAVAEPVVAMPVEAAKPARAVAPMAFPVAAPYARPKAVPSAEFDVELVEAVPAAAVAPRRGFFRITGRDWFFLALGAGGIIFAGLVGFALALVLRN